MRELTENTELLINTLLPDLVPNAGQFRRYFYELLNTNELKMDKDAIGIQWKELAWPKSNLTSNQMQDAFVECRTRHLDAVPVIAYLASLEQTRGTVFEEQAKYWACINAHILMLLAHRGNHDRNIITVCMRFRLAHQQDGKYAWLWQQLPSTGKNLDRLTRALEQLENETKAKEVQSISSLPINSSERIAEIRRVFEIALGLKNRIKRNHHGTKQSTIKHSITEDRLSGTDKDEPSLYAISFLSASIPGVDHREQQHDQQNDVILDNHFEPHVGTANSAGMQATVMLLQASHVKKQQFGFPTNPKLLTLSTYQNVFKHAYDAYSRGNLTACCVLLTFLTGTRPEAFFDIKSLLKRKKIMKDKETKQYFWIISLAISESKVLNIENHLINQQKSLSIPLPFDFLEALLVAEPIDRTELQAYLTLIRTDLKLPILSSERITSALYHIVKNDIADRHLADLLAGITPQHAPALYYCAHPIANLHTIYSSAIQLLAEKTLGKNPFDTGYLFGTKYQRTEQSIGSQVAPSTSLVRSFLKHLYDFVISQRDPFQQFNAYTLWMWHIFLLLTSCRPVDHVPGMLNQIDLHTNFIWVSDKEGRSSSSSGRFIPLCSFLVEEIQQYLDYLIAFRAKYGLLEEGIFSLITDILASKKPLLYLYTQQRLWQAVEPAHIKNFLHDIFPLPLNWARHFGRYFLQDKLPVHLIDAIFAHEQPDQEILNPYSALSLQDLLPAREIYQQMSVELGLKRMNIHVC